MTKNTHTNESPIIDKNKINEIDYQSKDFLNGLKRVKELIKETLEYKKIDTNKLDKNFTI